MLKPAQLYKEKLVEESINQWYKPENKFYSSIGDGIPEIPDDNYDGHHFISVDKNDDVIGYICYSINWPVFEF